MVENVLNVLKWVLSYYNYIYFNYFAPLLSTFIQIGGYYYSQKAEFKKMSSNVV